jgi:flavin-dependent dehydrogenase
MTNHLSVGDSAAFIDPFTGSGMLMAFESAAVLAAVINRNRQAPGAIPHSYRVEYDQKFSGRLRICSALRRAAFLPLVPAFAVSFLSVSRRGRGFLANATRSPHPRWTKNR